MFSVSNPSPFFCSLPVCLKELSVTNVRIEVASHRSPFARGSSKENPRWFMVDVKFVRKLSRPITLPELKKLHGQHNSSTTKGPLANMALLTRSRLSVQPVTDGEHVVCNRCATSTVTAQLVCSGPTYGQHDIRSCCIQFLNRDMSHVQTTAI